MYVLYWSDYGLKLYNELATKSILFLDASGTLVRKKNESKNILHHKLTVTHPVLGKMGITLTAMLA